MALNTPEDTPTLDNPELEAPAEEETTAETEAETPAEPEEEESLVITLGDDEPEPDTAADTPPIRQMRQALKDKDRELRRISQEIAQLKAGAPAVEETPGERPKLADFDFDEDKFSEALEGWTAKKAQAQAKAEAQQKQAEAQQKAWQDRVAGYQADAKKLRVPDFEDAEATVTSALSVVQQSLLLKAKKPEVLVYALGRSPKRLKELASIQDPVDFVFAVAEVQREIKVNKRTAPAPESTVRGSAVGAGAAMIATGNLEKLKEEARKTGDYSKYFAARDKAKK